MQAYEYGYLYTVRPNDSWGNPLYAITMDSEGPRLLGVISHAVEAMNRLGSQGWIIFQRQPGGGPTVSGFLHEIVCRSEERAISPNNSVYHESTFLLRRPRD